MQLEFGSDIDEAIEDMVMDESLGTHDIESADSDDDDGDMNDLSMEAGDGPLPETNTRRSLLVQLSSEKHTPEVLQEQDGILNEQVRNIDIYLTKSERGSRKKSKKSTHRLRYFLGAGLCCLVLSGLVLVVLAAAVISFLFLNSSNNCGLSIGGLQTGSERSPSTISQAPTSTSSGSQQP